MRHLVHVISDLHLGGAAATQDAAAFQMCPPKTRDLLAGFIRKLPPGSAERDSHLVIAGDIVDFLAEQPFQAFTGDATMACDKLRRIFASTAVVWEALREFCSRPHTLLTLMLGNHDIELSLPGVRELLLEQLPAPGVRFIYDNEAFTLGPLLIEHGNRFDAWNAVPHGALRRVRSQLSRKAAVIPPFEALPGSRMVIDVINPLKQQYPFIDLMKPETAAALPIAAALGGIGLQQVWTAFGKFRASKAVDFNEESGAPLRSNYISGKPASTDDQLWVEAQQIARGGSGRQVSAVGDLLSRGAAIVTEQIRAARLDAVFAAFRRLAELQRMHREAFDVGIEVDTYLNPARHTANAGFKVIVYGHTHLPKNVAIMLDNGAQASYLNTGTWADVMCVPNGIWDEDQEKGRALFQQFAADLGANSLSRWRRAIPTYAHIEINGDDVVKAELRFAQDDSPVSTVSLMQLLTGAASA
ncbi:metallophosphatase [Duganella sp. CY15W]|uniref:metallophosphoesterase n=1 Tax=Duganella sp. CY15W TaxID=2692172 RepID=UPI00136DA089|nr:metallophosphoesterase [Duganella sp. CY15W]MYM27967.1 metallophosphatase [Duganella sp. CY15W]